MRCLLLLRHKQRGPGLEHSGRLRSSQRPPGLGELQPVVKRMLVPQVQCSPSPESESSATNYPRLLIIFFPSLSLSLGLSMI